MQLPQFGKLSAAQVKAYNTPYDQSLFVVGPPGSGKTTLAIERAKLIARQEQRVLFITRNRMLAALAAQLAGGNISVQTMHTFAPTDYRARLNGNIPQPKPFVYDWATIMHDYSHNTSPPRFDHVVVDEGQNLPGEFYPWLVAHGAHHVTVFADGAQTTERTLSASIEDIQAAPLPPPQPLTDNHRNTREIALVAEFFHRSESVAPGHVLRLQSGTKPSLTAFIDWADVARTVAIRYKNRKGSIGIIVARKNDATTLLEHMRSEQLNDCITPNDRVDVYTSSTPPGQEHTIKIMSPGVTILTGESVIGLEFDCVYLQDLPRVRSALSTEACRRMYMLCARARDELILLNGPKPMTQAELKNLPDERLLSR